MPFSILFAIDLTTGAALFLGPDPVVEVRVRSNITLEPGRELHRAPSQDSMVGC
jgi:hypothetical protein